MSPTHQGRRSHLLDPAARGGADRPHVRHLVDRVRHLLDLGFLNIWIGLAIATAKAVLVGLYYMHLRWDKPFNAFVFLTAFAFLAIFVGIAMMDTGQYQQVIIPDFASAVGAAAAGE